MDGFHCTSLKRLLRILNIGIGMPVSVIPFLVALILHFTLVPHVVRARTQCFYYIDGTNGPPDELKFKGWKILDSCRFPKRSCEGSAKYCGTMRYFTYTYKQLCRRDWELIPPVPAYRRHSPPVTNQAIIRRE